MLISLADMRHLQQETVKYSDAQAKYNYTVGIIKAV